MTELVALLFLQLALILATCRFVTYVGKRYLGQTDVVCEMIAGIILGPTVLGLLLPSIQHWIFPLTPVLLANGREMANASMTLIYSISQLGLIMYMFLVGLEFDSTIVKERYKTVSAIVIAGVLTPFILGGVLSWMLFIKGGLFTPSVNLTTAILFFGICVSMTAFPMLARILYDKNLAKTNYGVLALASGSVGDVIGWCLLAIMLATIKHDVYSAWVTIIGGMLYIIFMLTWGKKILSVFFARYENKKNAAPLLAVALILILLSAWITDKIGIHAIFGAFIAGVAMPRGALLQRIQTKLETVTIAFLLPVFFVYSGLNTQIELINTLELWIIAGIIIIIAICGKLFACTLAAKGCGENWRDAFTIGTLMNARGLMELIILHIGLQYHLITPTLFSVMIVMTLVTTFMTSPLLHALVKTNLTIKR